MSYAAFDETINSWANENKLVVSVESSGDERRFCYVSGGIQECFQISIGPCSGEHVAVTAWDIETVDDAEMQASWQATAENLQAVLNSALGQVVAWSNRPKGPATWRIPSS